MSNTEKTVAETHPNILGQNAAGENIRISNEGMRFLNNELYSRSALWKDMLNVGKDINTSCGYPDQVTIKEYREMYDREGHAARVVNILPDESWSVPPRIVENESDKDTEFEKAWLDLQDDLNCTTYLQLVDELSGIGRYGALLLGLDDGRKLHQPVTGTDLNLLYLRAFDESRLEVISVESDVSNPRYGFPTMYAVQFETTATKQSGVSLTQMNVHWTRILHVADNLKSSEVYGVPRMQQVYNRLLDVRKILSGSGEMFWKGAFPGYVFEVNPDLTNPNLDKAGLRQEFEDYSNDLQRYLAIEGVSAKSLSPQVSDPTQHIDAQLNIVAMTLGIPKRIYMGAEQAKLASTTDKETWNSRLENRQRKYVAPKIIKRFITLLQSYGVLPKARFFIVWPDLNTRSNKEKAEVGLLLTKSLGEYVGKGVHKVIAPDAFLGLILGRSKEEITAVTKATKKWVKANPEATKLGEKEEKEPANENPGSGDSVEATGQEQTKLSGGSGAGVE
jgi:hypothetical protein